MCKQSLQGECTKAFQSKGVYHFSSGHVQENSEVSFGVVVYVDPPSQMFTSNINVEIDGKSENKAVIKVTHFKSVETF